MDVMNPFEVASGCDVVEIGRQYPELIIVRRHRQARAGGRQGGHRRDFLRDIMPAMVERGGYIPTCDHGVPSDVSYENYLYYRQMMAEMDH